MPRLVPDDSLRASPTDLETRALSAVIRSGRLGTLFMTALRRANQLLDAALLLQVAELRRAGDPVERAHARAKELELQLSFAFQTIDVLLERLGRVPPAHRPRYRNADRGRILHHKEAFQLSCREVARLYALTSSTVHRWVVDCVAPKRPERPLVAPAPPDRSYSALVRQQVVNLSMAGFGGSLRLAQTLAREGLLLSRSTVRRWTKETAPESPRADEADAKPASGTAAAGSAAQGTPSIVEPAVRARRPNHVPLAWRLFTTEPSAAEMAAVLDEAVARARRFHADVSLAHFVTDKGACFTAEEFQTAVARNGMKARYGAVGRHGSIALIERL